MHLLEIFGLSQQVDKPTRKNVSLDHIVTNVFVDCVDVLNYHYSDHDIVKISVIAVRGCKQQAKYYGYRTFRNFSVDDFQNELHLYSSEYRK